MANEIKETKRANINNLSMYDTPVERAFRNIPGCKNYLEPVPVSQAIKECGADFEVKKEMLIKVNDDVIKAIKEGGDYKSLIDLTSKDIVTSHMATFRDDSNDILGVVGKSYGVVQNAKAFEFIDIITSGYLGGDASVIETAGVLGKGERMYVAARMKNTIRLENASASDYMEDYILFTNTHDGSGGVMALFTPIRVLCENTLNFAIANCSNKFVLRHTSRVNERLDFSFEANVKRAKEVLGSHERYIKNLEAYMNRMASEKITREDTIKVVSGIFLSEAQQKLVEMAKFRFETVDEISTKSKNSIINMLNTIDNGVGQEFWKGTKLSVYNGVTSFFNNNKVYKGGSEERLNSLLEGDAYKKQQKAFQLLLSA